MTAPITTTATTLEGQILECVMALENYEEYSIFWSDRVSIDPDFITEEVEISIKMPISITYTGEQASFRVDPDKIIAATPG